MAVFPHTFTGLEGKILTQFDFLLTQAPVVTVAVSNFSFGLVFFSVVPLALAGLRGGILTHTGFYLGARQS